MKIERYVMGPIGTNTYLLEEEGKALLIDPASKAEKLFPLLEGKELLAILLTHGHFDHIKAVDGLVKEYRIPVYLHPADTEIATSEELYKQNMYRFGISARITVPLTGLQEGELKIGPFSCEVIHTPGHTPGSVLFRFGEELFSGDTLFKGSIGRTDLYGGDARQMKDSLRRIRELPAVCRVYPGHEGLTTLEEEFLRNPYL